MQKLWMAEKFYFSQCVKCQTITVWKLGRFAPTTLFAKKTVKTMLLKKIPKELVSRDDFWSE